MRRCLIFFKKQFGLDNMLSALIANKKIKLMAQSRKPARAGPHLGSDKKNKLMIIIFGFFSIF
jgi:hypothetical protein